MIKLLLIAITAEYLSAEGYVQFLGTPTGLSISLPCDTSLSDSSLHVERLHSTFACPHYRSAIVRNINYFIVIDLLDLA